MSAGCSGFGSTCQIDHFFALKFARPSAAWTSVLGIRSPMGSARTSTHCQGGPDRQQTNSTVHALGRTPSYRAITMGHAGLRAALGLFLGARQVTSPYDPSLTSVDGAASIGQADPYLC